MNPHPFIILITGFLILLWVYTAFSKLTDLPRFNHALMTQVFPKWIGKVLLFALPISEIAVVALLLIPETRLLGMYSSLFMMLLFTLYVGGAVFQLYERTPCACGGIFNRLGWQRHFRLNIILTIIALMGVILMEV